MMLQNYAFTSDWFTPHIPIFKKHLSHLIGRKCCILEVGCFEGRCTTWLIDNIATDKKSSIVCVDLCENENFKENIKKTDSSNRVSSYIGRSRNILRALVPNSFDFAYIDGSHSTIDVLEDAVLTFRLVKPGGIIAFDDYLWDDPKYNDQGTPKPAIDAFLSIYGKKIEALEIGGWQAWARKIED
jgi:predicted O-methyltransferase YrrM